MAQNAIKPRRTLWEEFEARNLSRRSFMKTVVALTATMGLAPSLVPKVALAAETKKLPVVIWFHGHECTGCSESFIRSTSPFASDVILNMIALEYDDTLAAAAGKPFEEHLEKVMEEYDGQFILACEGAVALYDEGTSCFVAGRPYQYDLKRAAERAAVIVEYGSCAAWGGIQAAAPNPTQSVEVGRVLNVKAPIIKVPGCPPIPEVMTGTIMHYALFGELPPLDSQGRPKQFYGNRIHDTCYRRAFFDSGMFVEKFDDIGAQSGWCLYKVGCRGPETYNSCGNMRWWGGLSYPIQSGHGCIGCSENNFWDNGDFYSRLPGVPTPDSIVDADVVGAAALGLTAAAVGVHAVATVASDKIIDARKKYQEQLAQTKASGVTEDESFSCEDTHKEGDE